MQVSNPATATQRHEDDIHFVPVDVMKEKQTIGKFDAEEGVQNLMAIYN